MVPTAESRLIECINTVLCGGPKITLEPQAAAELHNLAKSHRVHLLIYDAIAFTDSEDNTTVEWANEVLQGCLYDQLLVIEQTRVEQCLRENAIRFMPIKGATMKALYPMPYQRIVADIDFYVNPWKFETLKTVLAKIGYRTTLPDSPYDYHVGFWNETGIEIELHRKFIQDGERLSAFASDLQVYAEQPCGALNWDDETEYLYLFFHFTKHFLGAGTGIRAVLDLYLYRSKHSIDLCFVEKVLNQYGLLIFHERVLALSRRWFEGERIEDETLDLMQEVLFSSGTYGCMERWYANLFWNFQENGKNRFAYFLRRLFPSREAMHKLYPDRKHIAAWYPILWTTRFFDRLVHNHSGIQQEIKVVLSDKPEKYRFERLFY